jgi:hypothetical protein
VPGPELEELMRRKSEEENARDDFRTLEKELKSRKRETEKRRQKLKRQLRKAQRAIDEAAEGGDEATDPEAIADLHQEVRSAHTDVKHGRAWRGNDSLALLMYPLAARPPQGGAGGGEAGGACQRQGDPGPRALRAQVAGQGEVPSDSLR